jgi:UDP-glucose 4-epimerase
MSVKRTVAVTGVAGFIGSNLADRLLREGYDVIGVDDLSYGIREQIPEGVRFHEADIRSDAIFGVFEGADTVFHLAAKNCIADCQNDPVETAEINVSGSVRVFESARRSQVRKVVYAETSALYEGSLVFPTPESELAPQSFYAVSKLAERAFVEAYERFHGMRFTALRYFGVYGPRQDYRRSIPPVHSAFIIKLLRSERPTIYGDGEKRRDFVFVDDVNDFHLQCIEDARTDGEAFNLGSGVSTSVNELYALVSRMLGQDVRPEHKPDLAGEAETTHADIAKARALGWEPRVSLEAGLRRQIDYIKKEVLAIL